MNRKAKKNKNIFSKGMIWRIAYQGVMIGILTLLAFSIGCGFKFDALVDAEGVITAEGRLAQTMAFTVLAFSQLTHVYNLRSNKDSIFKVGLLTNKTLIGATLLSGLLMLIVLAIPFMQGIFEVAALPVNAILVAIGLILAPVLIVEIFKLLKINTIKEERE